MPDANTPISTKIEVAQILIELEHIKKDLACLVDYDTRLKKVERVTWMLSGVGSLLAAIIVPLAIAAIRKWLGL